MVKPYCVHDYESNWHTLKDGVNGDTVVTEHFTCKLCGQKKVAIKARNNIGMREVQIK